MTSPTSPPRDVSRDSWLPPVTRPAAEAAPESRTRMRDLHAFRVIDVFRGRSFFQRLADFRIFRGRGPKA